MNKLLSVVLALGLFSIYLPADQQSTASVGDEWQMSFESTRRTIVGPLKIQQEGSKITGTFESEHAGKLALAGKVEGNKLTFSMEPHSGVTLTFNGAVDGDKMSGTTDPASGSWSASRK